HRVDLDADLVAYYEAEARGGHRSSRDPVRSGLRERFAALLDAERRTRIVDVGAGPGLDAVEWHAVGFRVVGVDVTHANVALMRAKRLTSVTGSLYRLPFPTGAFDAVWTMNTFVHVPQRRFDEAIVEMIRVVRPGAPLAIGTWGGTDFEGVPEFGLLRPYHPPG